jgi:hypothetical protein
MTQEQKTLLLKDLCGRLPYGVIIEHEGNLSKLDTIFMCDSISISSTSIDKNLSYNLDLDEVKPYLFPISSMTAEQLYELRKMFGFEVEFGDGFIELSTFHHGRLGYLEMDALFEWFDKNHFDYRGLIPMGLANDATNLNIY